MPTALEQRALEAATAVAAEQGLGFDRGVVIHSGSNVLVCLEPAPVVARVMTGTVVLHDDPERWLSRETAVLAYLEPSGLAVAPSRLLAPKPYCHDGLWMTFTEWIDHVEPAPARVDRQEARRFGESLRELHEHLRSYDGDLGGLPDVYADVERLLARLQAPGRSAERLHALRGSVFEADLPAQPLHGDVSLRNLLRTPRGRLWNDFEDTFRGPVHWDVASAVGSLRNHGADAGSVRAMLDAYGWHDAQELEPFLAAQDVYDEIWRRYDRQRRGG